MDSEKEVVDKYIKKYKGRSVRSFQHIPELSSYCRNYYKGDDEDILFAHCDDDDYTAWYICDKEDPTNWIKQIHFGDSFYSSDEVIEERIEYY